MYWLPIECIFLNTRNNNKIFNNSKINTTNDNDKKLEEEYLYVNIDVEVYNTVLAYLNNIRKILNIVIEINLKDFPIEYDKKIDFIYSKCYLLLLCVVSTYHGWSKPLHANIPGNNNPAEDPPSDTLKKYIDEIYVLVDHIFDMGIEYLFRHYHDIVSAQQLLGLFSFHIGCYGWGGRDRKLVLGRISTSINKIHHVVSVPSLQRWGDGLSRSAQDSAAREGILPVLTASPSLESTTVYLNTRQRGDDVISIVHEDAWNSHRCGESRQKKRKNIFGWESLDWSLPGDPVSMKLDIQGDMQAQEIIPNNSSNKAIDSNKNDNTLMAPNTARDLYLPWNITSDVIDSHASNSYSTELEMKLNPCDVSKYMLENRSIDEVETWSQSDHKELLHRFNTF